MAFGYTLLDPLVVLLGTAYTFWLLATKPVRLMAFLPTALTIYFFIPFVTLLTLWQTVPLLLVIFILAKGKIHVPRGIQAIFALLFLLFFVSTAYASATGPDPARAIIRSFFYLSGFALFLFSYDMARSREGYRLVVVGLAVLSAILAIYGLYQIIAATTGLPFRGIARGFGEGQVAFEYGILRINSLASEPKRLGFPMFVGALAYFQLASWHRGKAQPRYIWRGVGILFTSIFTFSGSYFLAVAAFLVGALLIYPVRYQAIAIPALVVVVAFLSLGQNTTLYRALETGYERRNLELEVGIEGQTVYRTEFFALDYLENNPLNLITGVGVGQYFEVLNARYGNGVGKADDDILIPMNSAFLELIFDVTGIAALVLYMSLFALIWRLRQRGLPFLALALLFLVVQSFWIQTLLHLAVVAGVGLARLEAVRNEALPEPRLNRAGNISRFSGG